MTDVLLQLHDLLHSDRAEDAHDLLHRALDAGDVAVNETLTSLDALDRDLIDVTTRSGHVVAWVIAVPSDGHCDLYTGGDAQLSAMLDKAFQREES